MKTFNMPQIAVVRFCVEDIIAASGEAKPSAPSSNFENETERG